jgi:hypothetical protein
MYSDESAIFPHSRFSQNKQLGCAINRYRCHDQKLDPEVKAADPLTATEDRFPMVVQRTRNSPYTSRSRRE